MTWQQVEELMIHWLVEGGADAWFELSNIEMEQEELSSKTCECNCCRKITWAMHAELNEMFDATVSELLPEIRLKAANRSARRRGGTICSHLAAFRGEVGK